MDRHLVAGERLAGAGLVRRVRDPIEIACGLSCSRHGGGHGDALPVAESVVIGIEEGLVLAVVDLGNDDRPADAHPELVLFERRSGGREKVTRIEYVVAQEFPGSTVKAVRSREDDQIDDRSTAPKLRL